MSDDIVISVNNVSKAYRIWESPASRLTAPLFETAAKFLPVRLPLARRLRQRAARYYRDFWALRDISFEVHKGESAGIVGRNGSGKSTLLQIIAGTLQPTSGTAKVNGRVAALLELGSGFNPEFTGRENVYLNGAVLGLSRREMDARFDSIAAFADIGDFIEQPVKIYSTGMVVRLAFAVCVHVDASILIIDEALGVGDARFQLKCARTLDRFIDEGRTLLFVSHDTNSINRLCRLAVLLEHGQVHLVHMPRVVTNLYMKMMVDDRGLAAIAADLDKARASPFERIQGPGDPPGLPATATSDANANPEQTSRSQLPSQSSGPPARPAPAGDEPPKDSSPLTEFQMASAVSESEAMDKPVILTSEFNVGGKTARIETIELSDADGQLQRVFRSGDKVEIHARIRAHQDIHEPIFAFRIRNGKGVDIYGTNTLFLKTHTPNLRAGQIVEVSYRLSLNILAGPYFISCSCAHFEGSEFVVDHRRYDAVEIRVLQENPTFGIANCQAVISTAIIT